MRTIVVTNERGGIGKTTLTCHIAWHLAEQGKRVVVLDLDKQCHSAGMLKAEFEQIGPVQSILDFEPNEEPDPDELIAQAGNGFNKAPASQAKSGNSEHDDLLNSLGM